eukprot:2280824-Rhodomonas_salina.1
MNFDSALATSQMYSQYFGSSKRCWCSFPFGCFDLLRGPRDRDESVSTSKCAAGYFGNGSSCTACTTCDGTGQTEDTPCYGSSDRTCKCAAGTTEDLTNGGCCDDPDSD